MKKTLIAFLCTFIALPAMADNYIKFKASAIEDTINTMVPESHRASAADEYQKQMDSTTGKISVMGIYKVCAAAGFNINNTNGYNGCRLFINTIAEKSGFGSGNANQQNCKTKFNGIWALSPDGKQYQCVGKDGHKLVYHASCDGADGDCIRDFATLQTQEPNAREFIQAYGQQKNLQFTCWYKYDNRRGITSPLGQDYIKCSAGGRAYEFEFDDLIQDPGKTAVESENTALCEMFGGKIVKHPDSSIEKQWQSCEVSREICNGPLHNLAVKIGHNVMYQGYCRLSRTVKETSVVGLKTLPGVDSRVFYNTGAQMRAGMAKSQTEEYLRTKFPNETYINCDPNPKILNEGFGVDQDYVMTCTVGSKQVDFIFHDLTEGNDSRAATGMDAMQCIINGGTFKGESCRGPTKEECDALDATLRAKGSSEGAKWDDDVRACIMGNAMKTYKRDVTTGYIVGAVVIVGGTIAVIGTGGAALPAIVGGAEMLVTDLAINWAIDANHKRLSQGAVTRFVNFVEDADKCTTEACALKVLQSHYATLSGVMNDLNKDDLAVVDTTMERLFGLIQTEFVACGKNDIGQTVYANPADCAMQQSHLKLMDYIDPVSEPVLIIASIAYNPGYVTNKFMKMKNISKLAKLDDVGKHINSGLDIIRKQVDDLVSQRNVLDKQLSKLLEQYKFADVSSEEELTRFFAQHPDITTIQKSLDDVSQQIQNIRHSNPGLWIPGEDVANYYDVETLQKRLKNIADEDAAYISELEQKKAELVQTPYGISKYTEDVSDEIKKLEKQKSLLVDESLKTQGLATDDIYKVGKEELKVLEQSLRSKDSELEVSYQEMLQAKRNDDFSAWIKAFDDYEAKLKRYPEYKNLKDKVDSERRVLEAQSYKAQRLIEKDNPDVQTIQKQIDELNHTYSPEYTAYLNEKEYVDALLNDAKRTVGDKQNLVWWDAIPQDIKDKYVQYMDDTMVKSLASDPLIATYVKHWDLVKDNSSMYEDFLQMVERQLNANVFPETRGVNITAYHDPNTTTQGYHSGYNAQVGMNTYYYKGADVDKTVGTLKHEILGHHIDDVAPNYGLQGETMQGFVKENNNGFARITSHGNSDPNLVIAKSPITGTEFDVADASDATKEALRNDGWKVFETPDVDSYNKYRAEITEQAAWSITPTSNIKQKVNSYRKQHMTSN